MSSSNSSPSKEGLDHPVIWVGVITGTLVSLYVLDRIWWLAFPVVFSIVLYYICLPFIHYLEQKGMNQAQAVVTFLGGVSLLLALLIVFGFPWFVGKVAAFQNRAPEYLEALTRITNDVVISLEEYYPFLAEKHLADEVQGQMNKMGDLFVTDYLPDILIYLLSWIPSLLLIPYLTFFFLRDAGALKRLIMKGVPNAFFEKVLLLFHRMDNQIKQYFRGLMAMTAMDTVTLALGLVIVGLPYDNTFSFAEAFFLGAICAVLAWVPYVGTVMGCLIIILVCAMSAPGETLLIVSSIVLFVIVRLLDDFVYTPITIGKSLRVHPLLTVLIIFSGGLIGGVTGLLLAMPVLGVAMVLGEIFGQVWFDQRLRARHALSRKLVRSEARRDLFV